MTSTTPPAAVRADGYQTSQKLAFWSILISAFLAALKIVAGSVAGSTAVTTDGFESASDILASAIVLGGMLVARRPADQKFPYGYGRAESMAGVMVSTILLVFAALLGARSVVELMNPSPAPPLWAVIPLLISFAAKSVLASYKRRLGVQLGSAALKADAVNDFVDMISATVATIAVVVAAWRPQSLAYADPLGGLCIAAIIFFLAWRIFRQTSHELMDVMPETSLVDTVRKSAESVSGVRAIEKCMGRKSGLQFFFDLHLQVDPQMSVDDAHQLAHDVQRRIVEDCPFVKNVLVHVEPHYPD